MLRNGTLDQTGLYQAARQIFDEQYYLAQLKLEQLEELKKTDPFDHYLKVGWKLNCNPHPLFCSKFYLEQRPAIKIKEICPLIDYLEYGYQAGLEPHILFNTNYYCLKVGIEFKDWPSPLNHYLTKGYKFHSPHPLFDRGFYLSQIYTFTDYLQAAPTINIPRDYLQANLIDQFLTNSYKFPDINPLVHYLTQGYKQELSPHPLFLTPFYRLQHVELKDDNIDPLGHYLSSVDTNLSSPHPLFDICLILDQIENPNKNLLQCYLEDLANHLSPHQLFDYKFYNEQLKEINLEPTEPYILHYLRSGFRKNLRPNRMFDSEFYIKIYPDVQKFNGDPFTHYLWSGIYKNYHPHPFLDTNYILSKQSEDSSSSRNPLEIITLNPESGLTPCFGLELSNKIQAALSLSFPMILENCKKLDSRQPLSESFFSCYKDSFLTKDIQEIIAPNNAVGQQHNKRSADRVVLFCHNAEPSGISSIGLGLIKEITETYKIDCTVIFLRTGKMVELFEQYAKVINLAELSKKYQADNFTSLLMSILGPGRNLFLGISVECLPLIRLTASLGLQTVAAFHEFISPYISKDYFNLTISPPNCPVVFPSKIVQDDWLHYLDVKNTAVIRPGLTQASLATAPNKLRAKSLFTKKLGIPNSSKIIMASGSTIPRKACDIFTLMAEIVLEQTNDPTQHFVWVGGPSQEKIDQRININAYLDWILISRNNSKYKDNIHIIEWQPDIACAFEASDVFVMCSRMDPFPGVVIEAMAAGTPIVTFDDWIGSTEILDPTCARVVPYLNLNKLSEAVCELIQNPMLCKEMGENARKLYERHHTWLDYVNSLMEFICLTFSIPQIGNYNSNVVSGKSNPDQTKIPRLPGL